MLQLNFMGMFVAHISSEVERVCVTETAGGLLYAS